MGSGFSNWICVSLDALFLLSGGASTFAQEAPLDDWARAHGGFTRADEADERRGFCFCWTR
jgi:hypothetical protein